MAETVEKLSIQLDLDTGKVIEFFNTFAEKLGALAIAAEKAGVDVQKVVGAVDDGGKGAQALENTGAKAKEAQKELEGAEKAGAEVGKQVEKGSKQAQNSLEKLDNVGKRVFSALKSYAGPFVAMFGAKLMFTGFIDEASKLNDLSKAVRMNVSDLDAWQKANVAAGGSAEAFANAMKSFTERTGASGETFLKMGAQLNGMTGRQAEYAMKYLGLTRESASIFLENNKRMKELVSSYRELALTPKDSENARKFKILWQTTGMVVNSIGAHFARFFLPIVEKVVETFKNCALFINRHAQFIQVSLGLVATAAALAFGPRSILANLPKLLALIFSPIGAVVAGVVALGIAIDDLMSFVKGGGSVFEDLLESMGYSKDEIEAVRQTFKDAGQALSDLLDSLAPVGVVLREVFGQAVVILIQTIVGAIGGLARWLAQIIVDSKKLKESMVGAWEKIKQTFQEVVDFCTEKWNNFMAIFDKFKLPDFSSKLKPVQENLKGIFSFGNDEEKEITVVHKAPSGAVGNVQNPVSRVANSNTNSSVKVENNININGNVDDVSKVQKAVQQGTAQGLDMSNIDLINQSASGFISN